MNLAQLTVFMLQASAKIKQDIFACDEYEFKGHVSYRLQSQAPPA